MHPTLREGQVVLVFMSRNFQVGDVVVGVLNQREVVKRITKIREGAIFLEGDNVKESTDSKTHGWLSDRQVLGRVVFPFVSRR